MPRRVLLALAALGTLACTLATVFSWSGGLFWFFDLFSHFRLQYLVILLLCVPVLVGCRAWRWLAIAGLFAALNLGAIAPLYWGSLGPASAELAPLELVVFNVHHRNSRGSEVARYFADADADVVILIEATDEIAALVRAALPGYASTGLARDDAFGILLFSRVPIEESQTLYLAGSELPALSARIAGYSLLAIHTMPPVGRANTGLRDAMLAEAGAWARDALHPIIAGDLNATPWSSAFRELIDEAHLHNSQRGFGLQTSWPSQLWPLSIPIDHVLHGRELTTLRRSVGPFLGSDHRPVRVEIGLRRGFAPDGGGG